jgi:uncharacterized protein YyaL (SSP411 family)
MNIIRYLLVVFLLVGTVFPASAFEHEDSLVEFQEYSDNVIISNSEAKKPYFLLFSADWCYWCHQFANETLVRQDVADYLNQNFVNVFIDADMNNAAYVKYRAAGLPYTVFLNPDGTLYYKYAGTLYGDNFLAVIKEVAGKAGVGKYALGMEANQISYEPPAELSVSNLEDMLGTFKQGLQENFDYSEYGLGKGQKAIFPQSFMYLLENADASERQQIIEWTTKTLDRAIDRIFDPVEGGFFRYAETQRWKIPHFEKLADLNAGIVLLLYQANQASPSPRLKNAADKTLAYLTSTLFHSLTGTFLSFQVADHYYYTLNEEQRETTDKPKVTKKVFVDRLAVTLNYLIQVLEYSEDQSLEGQITQSLDFLANMIMQGGGMKRYYTIADKRWLLPASMSDHAYVARLFTVAASYFGNPGYAEVAARVLKAAVTDFYDKDKKIFIDPNVDDSTNIEYLMQMNGLFALSIASLDDSLGPGGRIIVESLITYFSLMGELLEDRFWDAVEWEFTEAYVPYLQALGAYISHQNSGS